MQKHRENQSQPEILEHTVTIIGKIRKVKLPKNKKVSDLLNALKSQHKESLGNFKFNSKTNVVLNGRVIKMDDKGELKEDPILTRVSTLSLTPQISGGN